MFLFLKGRGEKGQLVGRGVVLNKVILFLRLEILEVLIHCVSLLSLETQAHACCH